MIKKSSIWLLKSARRANKAINAVKPNKRLPNDTNKSEILDFEYKLNNRNNKPNNNKNKIVS